MLGLRLARIASVVLAAAGLVVPASLSAQDATVAPCRLCSATSNDSLNARPDAPLRLQVETRLDFDKVVFEGNGSALFALSPNGVSRLSGATAAAGARAMPGTVLIRGETARLDIPLVGAGDIEGALVKDDGSGFEWLDLELVDARGSTVATARSDYDGFFLFERVAYGSYGFRLSAASASAVRMSALIDATATVSPAKPVARVGAIRLLSASRIAAASVER